ncbi:MAG: hypothetical protein AAFY11_16055, partial [Cyanobacteria bacterium J06641_5]
CGYIGTALAEQWQMQGHFVTGTTTRPERRAALQFQCSHNQRSQLFRKGEDTALAGEASPVDWQAQVPGDLRKKRYLSFWKRAFLKSFTVIQ